MSFTFIDQYFKMLEQQLSQGETTDIKQGEISMWTYF